VRIRKFNIEAVIFRSAPKSVVPVRTRLEHKSTARQGALVFAADLKGSTAGGVRSLLFARVSLSVRLPALTGPG
jgi:hypothetical protein